MAVDYLLLRDGWGSLAPALAVDCGVTATELSELLTAARGPLASDEAVRLAFRGANGPRLVVAVPFADAEAGPGAPSEAERYFEAGLRLGAGGRAQPSGELRVWVSGEGAPNAGDTLPDVCRDAVWRGLYLGLQQVTQPESTDAEPAPVFADGGVVQPLTEARAKAAAWVRRLSERPANLLGPTELAAEIRDLVEGSEVSMEVWSLKEAQQRGFGAVAAVGGGSDRSPLVVRLSWGDRAATGVDVLGLVGKGITFDSGGINLKKDAGELAWMKSDMTAAATIASAMALAARYSAASNEAESTGAGAPMRRIEAILPLCDNAVSGGSMRPGDVVTHPDGSTTEIVDTDCEGRLVLADGIAWCRQQGYGSILDMGTLTDGGAGLRRAGLWSNDAEFAALLCEFGDGVADPLWQMPLPYGEQTAIESRVADRRNAPMDRPDIGQHAAIYLAGFATGARWAHFDIGGVAYLEHPIAGWPEGPTGATTVALSEAISAWASKDPRLSKQYA